VLAAGRLFLAKAVENREMMFRETDSASEFVPHDQARDMISRIEGFKKKSG
jgi:hypothetical protein